MKTLITAIALGLAAACLIYGLAVGGDKAKINKTTIDLGKVTAQDSTAKPIDEPKQTSESTRSGEEINWQVVSNGGADGTSTNYAHDGTVAQTAVGGGSSPNYVLNHGYWQDFGESQPSYSMEVRDTMGYIGASVTVEVTGFWPEGISSYDMIITFDETKLDFIEVSFTGTIADTYGADYTQGTETSSGVLHTMVFWFPPIEDMPPPGSGDLAWVTFDVLATEETSTELVLESISSYVDINGEPTDPTLTNGTVTIEQGQAYVCGDADASGDVDIDDVVYLIAYIFSGGPPPEPLEAGNADCSTGGVDIDDVVYLIAFIFSGGPPPCDTDGDGTPDC